MSRRQKQQRRTTRPNRKGRLALPGPWQPGERELEDPGTGFAEVGMYALNMPGAPRIFAGQAIQSVFHHPVAPLDPCPCGSGAPFAECHRNTEVVPLFCRDLGADTFDEIVACETTFAVLDDAAALQTLKAAPELNLTQEIRGRCFWQFIGSPPTTSPLGDHVFATVEWNPGRLYFVTMTEQRNQAIIAILQQRAGDVLGKPRTSRNEAEHLFREMIRQREE